MKVKNVRLMQLLQKGLLTLNYNNIGSDDGYKVFRTLRALRKSVEDIETQRTEIIRKHLTDDEIRKMQAYEAAEDKSAEGLMTAEEYSACQKKLTEAYLDIAPLLEDESEIDARPVSFKSYYSLKDANKEVLDFRMDDLLENILWKDE